MALIKFGAGIAGMSGSIAGTTFAKNRYGSYARNKTKPVNPNTAAQIAVRSAVSYLSQYWFNSMTATERAAWAQYAANVAVTNRLGESIYLTGFNHFVRSNSTLQNLGLPLVVDAPTVFTLPEKDNTIAVTAVVATQKITVAYDNALDWAGEVGGHLFLYQGKPVNSTRNFFAGPYKYIGKVDGAVEPPAGTVELSAVMPFAAGQNLNIQARIVRADGRMSEPFRCAVLTS